LLTVNNIFTDDMDTTVLPALDDLEIDIDGADELPITRAWTSQFNLRMTYSEGGLTPSVVRSLLTQVSATYRSDQGFTVALYDLLGVEL